MGYFDFSAFHHKEISSVSFQNSIVNVKFNLKQQALVVDLPSYYRLLSCCLS